MDSFFNHNTDNARDYILKLIHRNKLSTTIKLLSYCSQVMEPQTFDVSDEKYKSNILYYCSIIPYTVLSYYLAHCKPTHLLMYTYIYMYTYECMIFYSSEGTFKCIPLL